MAEEPETRMEVVGHDGITFSAKFAQIAKALVVAQGEMGDVIKSNSNPAFKTKYADLAAVIDATYPALQKAKIAVLQAPSASFEGKALLSVETILLHESGEYARNILTLKPSKDDPQGIGSAITYARRYALLSLCGVAPEDDDGNNASRTNGTSNGNGQQRGNGNGNAQQRGGGNASENGNGRRDEKPAAETPASQRGAAENDNRQAVKDAWTKISDLTKQRNVDRDTVLAIARELFPTKDAAGLSVEDLRALYTEVSRRYAARSAQAPPADDAERDLAKTDVESFFGD